MAPQQNLFLSKTTVQNIYKLKENTYRTKARNLSQTGCPRQAIMVFTLNPMIQEGDIMNKLALPARKRMSPA